MNSSTTIPAILIVDDEDVIRYFLERFLTREGYRVSTAVSGEGALEHLAVEEFDVVLLDLKMKGIGGLEVLAAVRQRWPATSVIVLTAYATLESAVEALRRGAHDYLFKPCKTLDLRESIRTGLLRRQEQLRLQQLAGHDQPIENARPTPQDVLPTNAAENDRFLEHAGLIVDAVRHIITLNGVLLDLSPTEFNLLAYLIRESPRVVSPKELTREVQQYDTDTQEAAETIRSHIYHIRRKIQAVTQGSVIRTVRGIGYALEG